MGSSITAAVFAALSLTSLVWAQTDAGGDDHLARDLATLQAFAATITVDDTGLKANWTGDDVCTFNATKCDIVPAGYKALVGLGRRRRREPIFHHHVQLTISIQTSINTVLAKACS